MSALHIALWFLLWLGQTLLNVVAPLPPSTCKEGTVDIGDGVQVPFICPEPGHSVSLMTTEKCVQHEVCLYVDVDRVCLTTRCP